MRQTGFGLQIETTDALPGLRPGSSDRPADVRVTVAPALDTAWLPDGAWYETKRLGPLGEPALQIHRPDERHPRWRFRYGDATTFEVSPAGDEIVCGWRAPLTLADTATYLLGPIFGFLLRLRGVTSLHASAVEIDDRAVVFAADAGMGKSTTAAAFARAGYRVLTDDVCPLKRRDDAFLAQPSYPRVRLWPPSVDGLALSPDEAPPLTPNWDKRGLELDAGGHRDEPAAIAHVFLLHYPDGATAPSLERADEKSSALALVTQVYGHAFTDERGRARDFDVLTALVERVPVWWLALPDDLAALPALVDLVVAHTREEASA